MQASPYAVAVGRDSNSSRKFRQRVDFDEHAGAQQVVEGSGVGRSMPERIVGQVGDDGVLQPPSCEVLGGPVDAIAESFYPTRLSRPA